MLAIRRLWRVFTGFCWCCCLWQELKPCLVSLVSLFAAPVGIMDRLQISLAIARLFLLCIRLYFTAPAFAIVALCFHAFLHIFPMRTSRALGYPVCRLLLLTGFKGYEVFKVQSFVFVVLGECGLTTSTMTRLYHAKNLLSTPFLKFIFHTLHFLPRSNVAKVKKFFENCC